MSEWLVSQALYSLSIATYLNATTNWRVRSMRDCMTDLGLSLMGLTSTDMSVNPWGAIGERHKTLTEYVQGLWVVTITTVGPNG